jgi:hypothetical protein
MTLVLARRKCKITKIVAERVQLFATARFALQAGLGIIAITYLYDILSILDTFPCSDWNAIGVPLVNF